MSRAQDAKVNYTSGEIVAILFNARGIKLSVEDVAFAAKVIDDYAASRCAPVEAQLEQAQLALGDAAREINVAGPVDHRIRILKTEWSRTILRLQEEKRAAESEVTKLREALRRAINFIEETADGMCVIGKETNCQRAARPIYKELNDFYEAVTPSREDDNGNV
jgi:hypothetical protein